ncbi:MAG: 5-formyltetrahydrofolate cyclo-ligase [Hellea sp.]|jgi:5-formyltetrahydrofolate cyclo-ligase|nr:5-formyltetrahydrofolate cyclo-ligase [Hellea sp.]
MQKKEARRKAKKIRAKENNNLSAFQIIENIPESTFSDKIIAGYWPLPNELDIIPLLKCCFAQGNKVSLPCTPEKGKPLLFRNWLPSDNLKEGLYGTREPFPEKAQVVPNLILLPLLAFTSEGCRLGYGGGYYDRTLASLRLNNDIFACGIAFAGQEVDFLPTDNFDQKLDGILTDKYFKAF